MEETAFYGTNPGNGCKPVLDERFGLKSLVDDRIDFAPFKTLKPSDRAFTYQSCADGETSRLLACLPSVPDLPAR
jgi:hypothetical protein